MKVYELIITFTLFVQIMVSQIQDKKLYEFLYGKWYVKYYYILTIGNTEFKYDEKKEYEDIIEKCLSSQFIIDSTRIENCCNKCEFLKCYFPFNKEITITEIPIIEVQSNEMRLHPGDELEDKVIGRTFIELLDNNFKSNKIKIIETACRTFSESNIIIFIVSENKIGLYTGEELFVLVKKRIKNR